MQQEVSHILQQLLPLIETTTQIEHLQNAIAQQDDKIHTLEAELTQARAKRATRKTRAQIDSLSAQLAVLRSGDSYRQGALWREQLASLSARQEAILLQNQGILSPLPESCCHPQALIFIYEALESDRAQTLPGAVRLWELSSERSALQKKLSEIESENQLRKNQFYHNMREKANQDADNGVGFAVLDSVLDSIFR